jgi:NADH-quinone oxidoreductase subunit J
MNSTELVLGQAYFWLCAALAVGGALATVLAKNPIRGAMGLLMMILAIAGIYLALHAQFLAAIQLIVYAGAIVVLFLFVTMLIGGGEVGDIRPRGSSLAARLTWPRIAALALALLLLAGLGYGIVTGQLSTAQGSAAAFANGSVQAIGQALYTEYLVPFELTSVLLLIGMIGAIVLARPPE